MAIISEAKLKAAIDNRKLQKSFSNHFFQPYNSALSITF